MASIAKELVSRVETTVTTVKEKIASHISLFTLSDEKITELIYETHVHADESFDEDSLFIVVENILKRATQIIDKVVQGSNVHVDNVDEKYPKIDLNVPLCTIKSVGSELSCKPPGEEIAHKTALSILQKLSTYTWEAKSVLTLAAFASDFGEFWHLASLYNSDHLAKQLAILKKVPQLIKPVELQKRRLAILEVSNLIKTVVRVISIFDEFEKLSANDPKDIPELPAALNHLPVDVYWTIVTIAAISTKISILLSDEPDKPHDLAPYSQKIHYVLNKLNLHLTISRKQLVEAEAFRKIRKLFSYSSTEVLEIIKALIFTKDTVQTLIDGSTNRTVSIETLRKKNTLLFFSSLDITDDDIALLKPVYDTTKKEKNYTIVWVPVVEQWTDELRKKFDALRPKIPWYIVQQFTTVVGIKYIKEVWQFKGKPTLVVLSPQGKVENTNAIHLIKSWGLKAFPFDSKIKEEKIIFFIGGKDTELIQNISKKVTTLQNDPVFKDKGIEYVWVGKSAQGGEDSSIVAKFWGGIESLFVNKAKTQDIDLITKDIQKLLAYKNESAWTVISRGSTVITTGHGSTILKVLDEVEKSKEVVKVSGIEKVIVEQQQIVTRTQTFRYCSHIDIPISAGKVPDSLKCPECPRTMEVELSQWPVTLLGYIWKLGEQGKPSLLNKPIFGPHGTSWPVLHAWGTRKFAYESMLSHSWLTQWPVVFGVLEPWRTSFYLGEVSILPAISDAILWKAGAADCEMWDGHCHSF
ncbi:hypothetical protein TIFTF001_040665 [Ficus carica]|uniref:Protein SIEVE ELEMENT OCCLUSION B n=1 Tax=Ficus carica TaxID=3494 RepID=A0AA87Z4E5_FICCA|nr:hypothetical protein TIFTF001_040664 [Ficus carica]GMN25100.1 hypothetical protein TIFTF001_040665 [Ficus carica]